MLSDFFIRFWHVIGGDHARFFPDSASAAAHSLNQTMLFLLILSLVMTGLIFAFLVYFCLRYRRRPGNEIARDVKVSYALEATWTFVPLVITLVAFAWGANQYLELVHPPRDAKSIYVVGKRWMWKFEHEDGISEINEIHLPVGQEVQFLMISQDVIHSLFLPDLRMKYDVLPGRYSKAWIKPEREGTFKLLCTQYCGTDHSRMAGTVTILSRQAFEAWREQMRSGLRVTESPSSRGYKVFLRHGCDSCHDGQNPIGPTLKGVWGSAVALADGTLVDADENYLRESVLNPHAKVVAGFPDAMPEFAGQLKEDEVHDLLSYLKSLAAWNSSAQGVSKND